ncbi:hypothetical protein [Alloacidobacterium sp.]|uniref:hypothetical protein n=1 Tax=Alloacidobacterium sp. TaxID=2951999 RepID=UPI002D2C741C|nr:hypothetical protein [Alloacidobacterium sp.]HYK37811.1 hypothetical protein [Alloacidobacterium sp.]
MGIPVALTENFVYEIADSPLNPAGFGEAFRRTAALAATCEADLTTLETLFGVNGGFGSTNRVNVSIDSSIAPKYLGFNEGFHNDGTTKIQIVPFAGQPTADEAVRAIFVAEMAEVLMDFRNQITGKPTWDPGDSMGEALSRVCAAVVRPKGYIDAGLSPGISRWMNYLNISFVQAIPVLDSHRPNFVDKDDITDSNPVSFGCGILFIYYLLSQLGHSLEEIIAKASLTLGNTYENLTGQPNGWTTFTDLLDLYFPELPILAYQPTGDNLFPLPRLVSLTLLPASVAAGEIARATVKLDAPFAPISLNVTTLSLDPSFATVPPKVTIPANSQKVTFVVNTPFIGGVFKTASVVICASLGGITVSATLEVKPTVEAGILKSLSLNPSTVTGGDTSEGTVTLEAAVSTPTLVGIAALDSGGGPGIIPRIAKSTTASVSPSVTVNAGCTQATFLIKTSAARTGPARTATIVAGAVVTKTAVLTVE